MKRVVVGPAFLSNIQTVMSMEGRPWADWAAGQAIEDEACSDATLFIRKMSYFSFNARLVNYTGLGGSMYLLWQWS